MRRFALVCLVAVLLAGSVSALRTGDLNVRGGIVLGEVYRTTWPASGDVNGEDIAVNYARFDLNADVRGNLSTLGDANMSSVYADYFFGDGSQLQNLVAAADVNGTDLEINYARFDLNVDVRGNISTLGDANMTRVYANYFFGDGSGLSNVTAVADVNGQDLAVNNLQVDLNLGVAGDSNLSQVGADDYFGLWRGTVFGAGYDSNYSQVTDFNLQYHSVYDLNLIYFTAEDVNLHFYGIVDVNTAFLPYEGATADTNTGVYGFTTQDLNAMIAVVNTHLFAGGATFTGDVAGISLNEVENPTGDKTFTMANTTLTWTWAAPTDIGFEIDVSGGFTGDGLHVHQHTGNTGVSNLLRAEAADADMTGINVGVVSGSTALFVQQGDVNINDDVNILGDTNLSNVKITGGLFGVDAIDDSNFANIEADYYYGDGSGLTNVTSSADVNGDDVAVNYLRVDLNADVRGNLSALADANMTRVEADYFFGDGSQLQNLTAAADVNGQDLAINYARFDLNVDVRGNLSVLGDANFAALYGTNLFGDASEVTGLTTTVTLDVNNLEQDWLFGLDLNVMASSATMDVNADEQNWLFGQDLNGGITTTMDVNDAEQNWLFLNDLNGDVNTAFVPYRGADKDVNLLSNGIAAEGDSNFAALEADFFFGDGSQLSNVTATADVNGQDLAVNALQVDLNFGVTGDSNVGELQADNYFGLWRGTVFGATYDTNYSQVTDFNSRYHSVYDLNAIYFTGEDVNAAFYGIVDVNFAFVPYIGAVADVNIGSYGLTAYDLNAISLTVEDSLYVESDLNVSSGVNRGVSINADSNRICFPANSCEMYLDYNGTALVIKGA